MKFSQKESSLKYCLMPLKPVLKCKEVDNNSLKKYFLKDQNSQEKNKTKQNYSWNSEN